MSLSAKIQQLEDNDPNLTSLNLTGNSIYQMKVGPYTERIANALVNNTNLTSLTLSDLHIRDQQIPLIGEALKVNTTLTQLDLSNNRFGSDGLIALADMLRVNKTLTDLNVLGQAKTFGEGALAEMGDMFNDNITIKNISWRLHSRISFRINGFITRNNEIERRKANGIDYNDLLPDNHPDRVDAPAPRSEPVREPEPEPVRNREPEPVRNTETVTNSPQRTAQPLQRTGSVKTPLTEPIREAIPDDSESNLRPSEHPDIKFRTSAGDPNQFLVKDEALDDIKDTNIENLGSDMHTGAVKDVAANSGDWDIIELGQPGLWIWRIEKFEVVPWPKEQYGEFYRGDSYIVLYGYLKDDQQLLYDLHFWLGQETTQDEAGTAAYKTVELDTYLDDLPIQYREVDGQETEKFLSYFPNGLIIMDGGVDSGFNHVEAETYEPRLLHVKGKGESVSVRQVELALSSLNSGDVFILDAGLKIYQFNGSRASVFEKQKGRQVTEGIYQQRSGEIHIYPIEEDDDDEEFWGYFGGKGPIAEDDVTQTDAEAAKEAGNELYRLSDATGELVFEFVAKGKEVTRDKLDTDDVFIVDVGYCLFVWIGSGATELEKKSGMKFAQMYLDRTYNGIALPISVVRESGCTKETYDKFFH